MRIQWQHESEDNYRSYLATLLSQGRVGKAYEVAHYNMGNDQFYSAETWMVMAEVAYATHRPQVAEAWLD